MHSQALECLGLLQEADELPQEYSPHSLRIGGISAALQVPGVLVTLEQHHG